MKRSGLILLAIILCPWSVTFACDACSFYEYNTLQNRSYFALFYRLRHFNGYQNGPSPTWHWTPADYRNAKISHEIANTNNTIWTPSKRDFMRLESYDLRFNHAFTVALPWKKKDGEKKEITFNATAQSGWNRNAFYLADIAKYTGITPTSHQDSLLETSGFQDLRLGLSIVETRYTGMFKHTFNLGAIVRLPIGKYNQLEPNGRLIHPELQVGTGAIDIMPRLTYQVVYDNHGLEMASNYRFAGTNSNKYKFGNSINIQADYFFAINLTDEFKIIPRAGYYYENEQQHTSAGELVAGTGGQAVFASCQFDVMYKSWALSLQFQQPTSNALIGNQLQNAGRFNTGLVYGW